MQRESVISGYREETVEGIRKEFLKLGANCKYRDCARVYHICKVDDINPILCRRNKCVRSCYQ
jgi:hypothetical protein